MFLARFTNPLRRRPARRDATARRVEALEGRRLLAAALDTTFNGTGYNVLVDGFYDRVNDVHALPDGRTLAAGVGRGVGFGVTRYTDAGVIDTTFGTNGQGEVSGFARVERLLVRPDGRIVVIGAASIGADLRVMQLTADGKLDATFGVNGARSISLAADSNEDVFGAALDAAGRILAVGSVRHGTISSGQWTAYIARFTSDGSLDTGFADGGTRQFQYGGGYELFGDVIVLNDGRIIAGGRIEQAGTTPRVSESVLVAYTDSGAPDPGFGPAGAGGVRVLSGSTNFTGVDTLAHRSGGSGGGFLAGAGAWLYALHADGSSDTAFGAGSGHVVAGSGFHFADLAVRGDGAIFGTGASAGQFAAMMLGPAGTPEESFAAGGLFTFDTGYSSQRGQAISLAGDGKLVLGGTVVSSDDRRGTVVARVAGLPGEFRPAWLATGSAATWDADSGTLTVTGAATVLGDPGDDQPIILADGASAVLTIDPMGATRVTVGGLKLSGGAAATMTAAARTLVIRSAGEFSVDGASQLDLGDNDVVIDYAGASPIGSSTGSTYTGILGMIQSGRTVNRTWDGPGIMTSMPDADAGLTGVGVGEAKALLGISGTETAVWNGHTVDATTVLVRYTYAGDANLDGQIDAGDYGIIDNFVQIPGANGYAQGDFNFDGFIDAGDYGIIDNYIQAQGSPLGSSMTAAAVEESTAGMQPSLSDAGSSAVPIARRPLTLPSGGKQGLIMLEGEEEERLVESVV